MCACHCRSSLSRFRRQNTHTRDLIGTKCSIEPKRNTHTHIEEHTHTETHTHDNSLEFIKE